MEITKRSVPIAALVICAMLSIVSMPMAMADEIEIEQGWHMADGDARHTSQSSYYVTHILSHENWELDLPMSTEMVVGNDGSMYVGLSNSSIAAIGQDGIIRWCIPIDGMIRNAPSISDDGIIYCITLPEWNLVGYLPGIMYAIGPDGTILHEREVPGISATSSPVVFGDQVFIYTMLEKRLIGKTNMSNQIWCFDSELTVEWTYSENYTTNSDSFYSTTPEPSIGPDGSLSVIFNSTLVHLSADGKKLWDFNPGFALEDLNTYTQRWNSVLIDDEGRIIMGYEDFGYSLWPNGTVYWKHHFVSNYILPLALDYGQIIFSDGQRIMSLRENGEMLWSGGYQDHYISKASLASSRVLVIPSYDSILLYNANGDGTTNLIDCIDADGIMEEWAVCYATIVQNNTICYQKFSNGHGKIVCLGLSETNDNIASANALSDTQTLQLFLVVVMIASLTFAVSLVIPKKKVPKQ